MILSNNKFLSLSEDLSQTFSAWIKTCVWESKLTEHKHVQKSDIAAETKIISVVSEIRNIKLVYKGSENANVTDCRVHMSFWFSLPFPHDQFSLDSLSLYRCEVSGSGGVYCRYVSIASRVVGECSATFAEIYLHNCWLWFQRVVFIWRHFPGLNCIIWSRYANNEWQCVLVICLPTVKQDEVVLWVKKENKLPENKVLACTNY